MGRGKILYTKKEKAKIRKVDQQTVLKKLEEHPAHFFEYVQHIKTKDFGYYEWYILIINEFRFRDGQCRECGCVETDCRQCIKKTGSACFWIEPDLCSACVEFKIKK